jgi:hypothetical protein
MATGLAVRKRRRRKLRALAMSGFGTVACLLFLVMRIHSPEASPTRSYELVTSPTPRPLPEPPKVQTEQEKEEALLNTLSDAGPVIITMADGSRQLFLTRP